MTLIIFNTKKKRLSLEFEAWSTKQYVLLLLVSFNFSSTFAFMEWTDPPISLAIGIVRFNLSIKLYD